MIQLFIGIVIGFSLAVFLVIYQIGPLASEAQKKALIRANERLKKIYQKEIELLQDIMLVQRKRLRECAESLAQLNFELYEEDIFTMTDMQNFLTIPMKKIRIKYDRCFITADEGPNYKEIEDLKRELAEIIERCGGTDE